jgi:hypothetical protein
MRQVPAIALALVLAGAPPLSAQTAEEEGSSLMEEGARLFLRGLMEELDPAIGELEGIAEEIEPAFREMARQMGPAFAEIMATIDNIRFYEAPVILENGDILIRRRADAPPYEPAEPEPADGSGDEIEL